MDRKEFLASIGISAATVAVFSCVGCSKGATGTPTAPTGVDFTLDLSASANANLGTNGGYIYSNGIIIAKSTSGAYLAVSQYCTHQTYKVIFKSNTNQFYCNNHGATFSATGVSSGIETKIPLTQYSTQLTGNNLRIYS